MNFNNNSWEQRKYSNEATLLRGLTYSPSDICVIGTRVLRSSNINEEYFEKHEDDVFVKSACVNIDRANDGDILITSANGSSKLVGKHAILHGISNENVVHGGFMLLAKAKNSRFLNASMSSSWYKKFIDLYASGGNGAIGNLSKTDLENCELYVPSDIEQVKIGRLFDQLDSLITLHQRKHVIFKWHRFGKSVLFCYSWEQRKLGDITYQSGVRNTEDLPYESYSVSNKDGFVSQKEQFKYGGLITSADKSRSIIVEPCTFAYNPARIDIGSIGYQNLCKNVIISPMYEIFKADNTVLKDRFLWHWLKTDIFTSIVLNNQEGGVRTCFNLPKFFSSLIVISKSVKEQEKIGQLFDQLDSLITLHQRKRLIKEVKKMLKKKQKELFSNYFEKWIHVYKEGAIRKVTMDKYKLSLSWVRKLAPKLRLYEIDRNSYQQLLNEYAKEHERQTTMDFHHHLKSAILDAVDEGLILRDPTRKVIIKGKSPKEKKKKYLNQFELHTLLNTLNLSAGINYDWLILLIAKTGMRFSEAIALTPADFDFVHQTLSINKTWNYKDKGGFQPTKNKSSVRKIQIDWMVVSQFSALVKNLPNDKPIFIKDVIFNSTINEILARHCKKCGIPIITVHGLRHTHASLLLFGGVSIASVAKRLGHSSMNTTEKTYLHIIQELENKDVDLVMRSLSGLC